MHDKEESPDPVRIYRHGAYTGSTGDRRIRQDHSQQMLPDGSSFSMRSEGESLRTFLSFHRHMIIGTFEVLITPRKTSFI